jgi:hypothetical protein
MWQTPKTTMGELLNGRFHAAARPSWNGCQVWTSSSTAWELLRWFIASIRLNGAPGVVRRRAAGAFADRWAPVSPVNKYDAQEKDFAGRAGLIK